MDGSSSAASAAGTASGTPDPGGEPVPPLRLAPCRRRDPDGPVTTARGGASLVCDSPVVSSSAPSPTIGGSSASAPVAVTAPAGGACGAPRVHSLATPQRRRHVLSPVALALDNTRSALSAAPTPGSRPGGPDCAPGPVPAAAPASAEDPASQPEARFQRKGGRAKSAPQPSPRQSTLDSFWMPSATPVLRPSAAASPAVASPAPAADVISDA